VHPVAAALQSRYRIERVLRRRGATTTWKARRRSDGAAVCLKAVYDPDGPPESYARLDREALLLQGVRMREVCRLLDFGPLAGGYYLVTDWVAGQTVGRWRQDAPSRERVQAVVSGVCRALGRLHASGLVHRDVHPGNIVVGPGDRVTLVDLGLGLQSDAPDRTRLTGSLVVPGTPRYLAPELVAGDVATPASDVFSAGCIAWEILCGQAPWRHHDPVTEATMRLTLPLPSAWSAAPRLRVSEHRLLSQMLVLEPQARLTGLSAAAAWRAMAWRTRWLG
jgi:serine/threonine-protein kinase